VGLEQTDSRNPFLKNLAGVLLGFARLVLRVYWKVRRPLTLGAVAIVLDQEHKVLLVEHSYEPGWRLPGGGVSRGESVCDTIARELYEELGIACNVEPGAYLGTFYSHTDGKHDHVTLFLVNEWEHDEGKRVSFEIKRWGFFSHTALPNGTTTPCRRRLAEFFSGAPATPTW
jgi:8-oxo-dGTP pyrophosphatase MutT (NUDIX family)